MVETRESREGYSNRFQFSTDPKWRRSGHERRTKGALAGKSLFRRRIGDRRIGFLSRISRFIFPRGFQHEG